MKCFTYTQLFVFRTWHPSPHPPTELFQHHVVGVTGVVDEASVGGAAQHPVGGDIARFVSLDVSI